MSKVVVVDVLSCKVIVVGELPAQVGVPPHVARVLSCRWWADWKEQQVHQEFKDSDRKAREDRRKQHEIEDKLAKAEVRARKKGRKTRKHK